MLISNQTPLKLNSRFLLLITMLYLTVSLAADVIAYKFVDIGPLITPGATIVFPITYALSDILTEVYGYSITRKIIWLGLACELIFAALIELVIHLHSAPGFPFQQEYVDVLSPIFRFVIAGIIANVSSSFLNIYTLSKFKIFMQGRNFILRSIVSTIIAEAAMNIIICGIAFSSVASTKMLLIITLTAYLLEVIYAFIFVFPCWAIIIILKRHENIDAYDRGVNYNIFRFLD